MMFFIITFVTCDDLSRLLFISDWKWCGSWNRLSNILPDEPSVSDASVVTVVLSDTTATCLEGNNVMYKGVNDAGKSWLQGSESGLEVTTGQNGKTWRYL